jgi:hypothetical protein
MRLFLFFFTISFLLSYIQLSYGITFLMTYTIFSIGWFGSTIFDYIIKNKNDETG